MDFEVGQIRFESWFCCYFLGNLLLEADFFIFFVMGIITIPTSRVVGRIKLNDRCFSSAEMRWQKSAILFIDCRSDLHGTAFLSPQLHPPPCPTQGVTLPAGGWPMRCRQQLFLSSGFLAFGWWGVPAGDQRDRGECNQVYSLISCPSESPEAGYVPDNNLPSQGSPLYDRLLSGNTDPSLTLSL